LISSGFNCNITRCSRIRIWWCVTGRTTKYRSMVAATGNWGPYGPYLGTYWGFLYNTISACSTREGMLVVDLIDAKNKDLAWRLYLVRKIVKVDKDWPKADQDFTKGFQSYPPNKRSERLAMAATGFRGWWRESIVDYLTGFAIR
jgi:Domain of unknown function (DUF4136)